MRVIFIIITLIAFAFALALVLLNNQLTDVNLVFTQIAGMNTGLLLIIVLALGVFIGILLSLQLFRVFQLKWENARLVKQVKSLEAQKLELSTKLESQKIQSAAPITETQTAETRAPSTGL